MLGEEVRRKDECAQFVEAEMVSLRTLILVPSLLLLLDVLPSRVAIVG